MHSLDPTEDFAIRLVRRFLLLCEHPRTRQRMLRLVRQSTRVGPEAPKLYGWINRAVLHPRFQPVVERRAMSAMKAELVASQLIGLAMTRYVLKIEPLASAPVDEVVAMVAPAINAALQPGSVGGHRSERARSGVIARRGRDDVLVRPSSVRNAASAPLRGRAVGGHPRIQAEGPDAFTAVVGDDAPEPVIAARRRTRLLRAPRLPGAGAVRRTAARVRVRA